MRNDSAREPGDPADTPLSDQPSENRPVEFQILVAEKDEGGSYANFLSVWHTRHEFTLDFASTQPPTIADPEDPSAAVVVPCRVVSRVKIPVSLVFEVLKALNQNMTIYEGQFGDVSQGAGEEEPDDLSSD